MLYVFCIRNVVIKTTFNFKFRVYDVILEKELGGIEIQMIFKNRVRNTAAR